MTPERPETDTVVVASAPHRRTAPHPDPEGEPDGGLSKKLLRHVIHRPDGTTPARLTADCLAQLDGLAGNTLVIGWDAARTDGVPTPGWDPDQYLASLALELPLAGPAVQPMRDETARWVDIRMIRDTRLPPFETLLANILAPASLLGDALNDLSQNSGELPDPLWPHRLLVSLCRAGGLVARRTDEVKGGSSMTPQPSKEPGIANDAMWEHIPEFRPARWPRRSHDIGSLAVVIGRAAISDLTATIDSILAAYTRDVHIEVPELAPETRERVETVYRDEPLVSTVAPRRPLPPRLLFVQAGTRLSPQSSDAIDDLHRDHRSSTILVAGPREGSSALCASVLTGSAQRASALVGGSLRPWDLAELLAAVETHYLTWWTSWADVSIASATPAATGADLFEGTSAPPRGVLEEIERTQRRYETERDRRRRAEAEVRRIRDGRLYRVGRSLKHQAERLRRRDA